MKNSIFKLLLLCAIPFVLEANEIVAEKNNEISLIEICQKQKEALDESYTKQTKLCAKFQIKKSADCKKEIELCSKAPTKKENQSLCKMQSRAIKKDIQEQITDAEQKQKDLQEEEQNIKELMTEIETQIKTLGNEREQQVSNLKDQYEEAVTDFKEVAKEKAQNITNAIKEYSSKLEQLKEAEGKSKVAYKTGLESLTENCKESAIASTNAIKAQILVSIKNKTLNILNILKIIKSFNPSFKFKRTLQAVEYWAKNRSKQHFNTCLYSESTLKSKKALLAQYQSVLSQAQKQEQTINKERQSLINQLNELQNNEIPNKQKKLLEKFERDMNNIEKVTSTEINSQRNKLVLQTQKLQQKQAEIQRNTQKQASLHQLLSGEQKIGKEETLFKGLDLSIEDFNDLVSVITDTERRLNSMTKQCCEDSNVRKRLSLNHFCSKSNGSRKTFNRKARGGSQ